MANPDEGVRSEAWSITPNLIESRLVTAAEVLKSSDEPRKLDSKDVEEWFCRGLALDKLERYDDTIECFNKTIQIRPLSAESWYNRACAKVRRGYIDDGQQDLARTIEIDVKDKYSNAAKTDNAFDLIRKDKRFEALITN